MPPAYASSASHSYKSGATAAAVLRAGSHDVSFKDQSRSVAVPSRDVMIVDGDAVQAIPLAIPVAGVDTSDISDERSANTHRTRQSSEPDGRRPGDP
jgi:hypothetical protein